MHFHFNLIVGQTPVFVMRKKQRTRFIHVKSSFAQAQQSRNSRNNHIFSDHFPRKWCVFAGKSHFGTGFPDAVFQPFTPSAAPQRGRNSPRHLPSSYQPSEMIKTQFEQSISGWWYTYPSEKYENHLGWLFLIYGKNRKCSKPPTRFIYAHIVSYCLNDCRIIQLCRTN